MKHRINIRGVMIPNNYKWFYDWLKEESTCPADIQKILDSFVEGDEIEVFINSPGGVIDVGSEIYTLLRSHSEHVKIYITGEACSAASIVAMAAYCEMSPTALMMVHCVSSGINGNHADMEHMAEVLRTADAALCSAYVVKSGMSEDEVLKMMEHETWLTAQQAKEKGLIDVIMFDTVTKELPLVDGPIFTLPSEEQMARVKRMMETVSDKDESAVSLSWAQYNILKLGGEKRS